MQDWLGILDSWNILVGLVSLLASAASLLTSLVVAAACLREIREIGGILATLGSWTLKFRTHFLKIYRKYNFRPGIVRGLRHPELWSRPPFSEYLRLASKHFSIEHVRCFGLQLRSPSVTPCFQVSQCTEHPFHTKSTRGESNDQWKHNIHMQFPISFEFCSRMRGLPGSLRFMSQIRFSVSQTSISNAATLVVTSSHDSSTTDKNLVTNGWGGGREKLKVG